MATSKKEVRLEGEPSSPGDLSAKVGASEGDSETPQNTASHAAGESVKAASSSDLIFDLHPGEKIRITVESLADKGAEFEHRVRVFIEETRSDSSDENRSGHVILQPVYEKRDIHPGSLSASLKTRLIIAARSWPYPLETTLFGLALLIYLAARLIGLVNFPIYFFTDEAVQTVTAADLIRDHFIDAEGNFLPTFFKNGPYYNLGVSVYLQVIPYLFFGKSVFVTRTVSVLVGLLAPISVALVLRNVFKIPYWWAGALLLSSAPAWFLHSRTAFETVLFVAFYAGFLYTYLLYRQGSYRHLYYAICLAGLAFYSYSPGQLVIGLTGLLLLISDAPYHWQNRGIVLRGLGIIALLALPYLRFRLNHPAAPFEHLRILGSYWVQPLSLNEKISHYLSEYLYGLSPGYWFIPNERDLMRHLMKGYGHLLRPTLPFAALGTWIALKGLRNPTNRTLLIALLVAPAGSALVQIGITRVLVFVIPAVILITLGVSQSLTWLERIKIPRSLLATGLFLALGSLNLYMLQDALVNGPIWYRDYGLGGMQYGARQLFPLIRKMLEESPQIRVIISPTWANGTDVVARFFLDDNLAYQMGSIDGHLHQYLPLDESTLFVMTPDEYQKALASGKFKDIRIERTLPYPNGQPGFYFAHLTYIDDIQTVLAQEREQRKILRTDTVTIDGEPVQVQYSMLDIGEPGYMFDGDPNTLSRTFEANPAIVELTFPRPKTISGFSMIIGSTEVEIKALLSEKKDVLPIEFFGTFQGTIDQPEITFNFGGPVTATILRLEVRDIHQGEPANVHIWEITLH